MFFKVLKKNLNTIKENLCVHGRVKFDQNGAALAWSASGFTINFKGRIAVFSFCELSNIDTSVIIRIKADGVNSKYSISNGKENIIIDFEKDGAHSIELLRISFSSGALYVKNVAIYGGNPEIQKAQKDYRLKMEFLGDSITCGYGLYGVEERYVSFEEDATKTYAYLTAKHFNAEARLLGWSGTGISCSCSGQTSNNFDRFFTRELPTSDNNSWDFSVWQPDVLVINGGTNDCGGGASKDDYKAAAKNLYALARKVYPNARIVFCLGAMGNAYHNQLDELCREINTTDTNVYYKRLSSICDNRDLYVGANGHPSFIGQQRTAAELIEFLEKII